MKKFIFISLFLICFTVNCIAEDTPNDTDSINNITLKEPLVNVFYEGEGMVIDNPQNIRLFIWTMNGQLAEVTEESSIRLTDYPHGVYIITNEKRSIVKKVVHYQHI